MLIASAVFALIALALAYYYVPRKPVLDATTLCPTTGPHGIIVVLVDTSDDLPSTTQQEVLGLLNDQINSLPDYYRLDIRVLDIPEIAQPFSLFEMQSRRRAGNSPSGRVTHVSRACAGASEPKGPPKRR